MKKNINRDLYNEKYLNHLKHLVDQNDLQDIQKYLNDKKPSNSFLNWIITNKSINNEIKNIFINEIHKIKVENDKFIENFLLIFNKDGIAKFLNVRLNTLTYILYVASEYDKYTEFLIKKKNGGERTISSPNLALKKWQKKLNNVFQLLYKNKTAAHGFINDKSIITNASKHIKKRNVLNIDIKDFFPSINFGRVRGLFLKSPFNFTEEVATILAQICCNKNQLPQGAPTSPILSNMICSRLDQKLMKLAQKHFCTYTRYADDITFSNNKYYLPENIAEEISQIIREEGFEVNEAKVRNQTRAIRQEVTGLTVNEKININRIYIRKVRAILHSWETKGYETASNKFFFIFDRHRVRKPRLSNSVKGKIEFIGSIRGKNDFIYIKLIERYSKLSGDTNVNKFELYQKEKRLKKEKLKKEIEDKFKKIKDTYDINLEHQPLKLLEFISLFTIRPSDLQKLIHTPDDPMLNFDLKSIYSNSLKQFSQYKSILPSDFRHTIKKYLFREYRIKGNEIWRATGCSKSPYAMDKEFEKLINEFKRKYRFGPSGNQETNLLEKIRSILSEKNMNDLLGKVDFNDKDLKDVYLNTDVDGVSIGFRAILNTIKEYLSSTQKVKLRIEQNYSRNENIINLFIEHIGSFVNKEIEKFVQRLNNNEGQFSEIKHLRLKSRCDWHIESIFIDGKSYRVKVLSRGYSNCKSTYEEIEPLGANIFRHKLIFY